MDAVACVGDDHLVAGRREVCPEGRLADGDGIRGWRGHNVGQVGLSVDDAYRAIGLVHDEGALGVGGHDSVDRTAAHGDWIGIDGVAGGLDGGDLTGAAADALADGVDAWGAGNADYIDRREGWVDGEFLLQVEGLANELGDGVQAWVGDVGIGALRKDADRVGTGKKRGLEDLALQELGADVEGGQGMVAVEGVAGVAAAVEDQIVGIYADLGGDENRVAGEVDEGDQAWSGIEERNRRVGPCSSGGEGEIDRGA